MRAHARLCVCMCVGALVPVHACVRHCCVRHCSVRYCACTCMCAPLLCASLLCASLCLHMYVCATVVCVTVVCVTVPAHVCVRHCACTWVLCFCQTPEFPEPLNEYVFYDTDTTPEGKKHYLPGVSSVRYGIWFWPTLHLDISCTLY